MLYAPFPGARRCDGVSCSHPFLTLSSGLALPKHGAENLSQCLRRQSVQFGPVLTAAKVCLLLWKWPPLFSPSFWLPQDWWGKSHHLGAWSSIHVGSKLTQQRTLLPSPFSLLNQFLAHLADFHYLLSLLIPWTAKAFFIFLRVPSYRCIQNENLERVQL